MTTDLIKSALQSKSAGESILLVGPQASGKTTQGLTLPKPCLDIVFDPNGLPSVEGFDIDTIAFLPEVTGVAPRVPTPKETKRTKEIKFRPDTYERFLAWINPSFADGTFDKYASIMLDGTSYLELAIVEWLMYEVNRFGQAPDKDDIALVRDNLMAALYPITALAGQGKIVLVLSHRRDKTNRGGDVIGQMIKLYGAARQDVPTMFGQVFSAEYVPGEGPKKDKGAKYIVHTRPTDTLDLGRTTLKRRVLPPIIDVTIKDFDHPEQYGIGKLIADIKADNYPVFAAQPEE